MLVGRTTISLSLVLSSIGFIIFIPSDSNAFETEIMDSHTKEACKDLKVIIGENKNFQANCELSHSKAGLKCIGALNASSLMNFNTLNHVRDIQFCGWQEFTFDPVLTMKHFTGAKYLDISYGNLTDIVNNFPEMPFLQVINISFTRLSTINVNLVKSIRSLKVLDLRYNKLKFMEAPLALPPALQKLYLSGNVWNCSRSLRWLLNFEKPSILLDRTIMVCSDPKYQGRNLATVAYYKRASKTECQSHEELRNCSCSVHYILKNENGTSLTPIYAINCSSLNFYNLPSFIPQNATILHANNNKISDIRPLRDNAQYRNVIDVYLDNNDIRDIDALETGHWLSHFRVLSLRKNKLEKLPVYAIENALENNLNAGKLLLSHNPWVCDCKFAMRFREILSKYNAIIRDSLNVTCFVTNEDDEIVKRTVLSLKRIDVCKLQTNNSIYVLDLLNCVLASLILFILLKLGYDYYQYKNYGHLPWIVTKIP